jgi:type II secretory pathway component PulJ
LFQIVWNILTLLLVQVLLLFSYHGYKKESIKHLTLKEQTEKIKRLEQALGASEQALGESEQA